MKSLIKGETFSLGLAMFSMFFGAGNIIFPLAVGQFAGDKNFYAMLGLIITAAIMPILGVIAMIMYEGSYKGFFGRLGSSSGFLLALTIISLLGPLGSTPRCIALAYTTVKNIFFDMPYVAFSAGACILIYFCTVKRHNILTLLGWVLTPFLLGSLFLIIFIGLFRAPDPISVQGGGTEMFFHGLKEGYNTMDLLAAFFFSSTILNILRLRGPNCEESKTNNLRIALRASVIGAILLAAVYIGFSYLASFHAGDLSMTAKDQILAAITMKIAGPYAGALVCISIALACLTTAIALVVAFSDFVQKEIFHEKISYRLCLVGALVITFFVSTFEFSGISAFLGPILEICYPGLIVLTILNIVYRIKNFEPVKVPVFIAFGLGAIMYFL